MPVSQEVMLKVCTAVMESESAAAGPRSVGVEFGNPRSVVESAGHRLPKLFPHPPGGVTTSA